MINAILIDDECDGLEDLQEAIVKYCKEINIVGVYSNPTDALQAIAQVKYQPGDHR